MSLIQFLSSKSFLKQLILVVVVFVLIGIGVIKWLDISTHHDQKIEVPDLSKMKIEKVEKTLKELDLKFVVIDSASFNPAYPENSVIDQTPEKGDFVKENRKIYLTLNPSGYGKIDIPDLYGKTKRQALSHLAAIGFRISSNYRYVPDIAKDVVRGLSFNGKRLKAGDKIPKNSMITLKLGDGKGSVRYKQSSED